MGAILFFAVPIALGIGLGVVVKRSTQSVPAGVLAGALSLVAGAAHLYHVLGLAFGEAPRETSAYDRIALEAWPLLLVVYMVAPTFVVVPFQRAWRRAGERPSDEAPA